MTNADRIRKMEDEELVTLLVWGMVDWESVPECDEGCEDFKAGCATSCPNDKRERAVRKWLKEFV